MPAAYDKYDYRSYWKHRDYEHLCEVVAIKDLLEKIPKIATILDIGAGYGRLTPFYLHRAKKIILTDPSAKNLKSARQAFASRKFKFVQTKAENLNKHIKKGSVELVTMFRVLHHIKDFDKLLENVSRMLDAKGYFLFEFPNKRHFKAILKQFFKGDITFGFDIFPKDLSSKRKKANLPFINYHPDDIYQKLDNHNFDILDKRSVSNIRHDLLKKWFPIDTLLNFEKSIQKPLASINFGPSIFVLARKRGR